MSQILYQCAHDQWGEVEVQAGWDRSVGAYHWTVFSPEEEILDSDDLSRDVTAFGVCLHLRGLGLGVPEGLESVLQDHRDKNLGNVRVRMALE